MGTFAGHTLTEQKNESIRIETMHPGAKLSNVLPDWVKLAIADAIVVFGRLEQEIIEIAWIMIGAEDKLERAKVARTSATDNFLEVIAAVEKMAGQEFVPLRSTFEKLASDRNLIVHGAWTIIDDHRPYVVWHKFVEDGESVIGQFYDRERFADFMLRANHLLELCRKFHKELERATGKKTSALGDIS